MSPFAANVIGFLGMACIVGAYVYITANPRPNPFLQHGFNLLGAVLLALSLTINVNVPSLVLEGIWAAVAIWGLIKAVRTRRRRQRGGIRA